MKRIKLIIVTAVAMAVMVGAMVSPASAALDDWGWSEWQQWDPNSSWFCSWFWVHDTETGWDVQQIFCYNVATGEVWSWPH